MKKVEYSIKNKDGIVAEQNEAGLVLIEEQRHIDGNWLILGTPEEYAEKFPSSPLDEVASLKKEVADLKSQMATLTGKVGTVEGKLSVLEAKEVVKG